MVRSLVMLFFSSFVNQMPVVHPPTWALGRTPQLLVGAMQACGALYVKTRAANAFITSTLAQARDPLVAQFVRADGIGTGRSSHLLFTGERNCHSAGSDIHDLGRDFATDIGPLPSTLGTAFDRHDVPFDASSCTSSCPVAGSCVNTSNQMIRRSGIMSEIAAWNIPDIDNVSDVAIEEAWQDWTVIEMGKRYVPIAAPETSLIPETLERLAWHSCMTARIASTSPSKLVRFHSIRLCFC